MPRKQRLTPAEKERIVQGLGYWFSVEGLARELGWGPIKNIEVSLKKNVTKVRKDKGRQRTVTTRDIRNRMEVVRYPGATSATLFKDAGIRPVSKNTRCLVSKKSKNVKPISRLSLNRLQKNMEKALLGSGSIWKLTSEIFSLGMRLELLWMACCWVVWESKMNTRDMVSCFYWSQSNWTSVIPF